MINFLLVGVALAIAGAMLHPSVRNSSLWRATVTPLASIIGSGFLVSGPLLTHIVGAWAPAAMLGILVIAFAIGAVIRFNIKYEELVLSGPQHAFSIRTLQRLSDLALAFAYIVSVAFYVRLLASFVFRFFEFRNDVAENSLTTAVLLLIALVGWFRGLGGLERMEEAAVTIKLAIIAALLFGLLGFDVTWFEGGAVSGNPTWDLSSVERFRLLAGLLLIVQGFETSRYLGNSYDPSMRIRSMKLAQLIASFIYLFFVMLALPLLLEFHIAADETAIISLAERVALVLPGMIVLAAVMSQFSAAVADTAGAGGLLDEMSAGKISARSSYVGLIITAIVLVWVANVFEIITLASRIFAVYYLLQCLAAIFVSRMAGHGGATERRLRILSIALLAAFLAIVVLFATPVA